MPSVAGAQATLERKVWEQHAGGVQLGALRRARLTGSRRPSRLPLPADFCVAEHEEGVRVRFSLPPGAYATSLLREFMRNDGALEADPEVDETPVEAAS